MKPRTTASALAIAFLSLAAPVLAAPEVVTRTTDLEPKDTAHVYLGACEHGSLTGKHFSGLPDCATLVAVHAVDSQHLEIVAIEGAVMHAQHSPSAKQVGRLSAGSRVRLIATYATGQPDGKQYVWGHVQRPSDHASNAEASGLERVPTFAENAVSPLDDSPTLPESAVCDTSTRPPSVAPSRPVEPGHLTEHKQA